MSKDDPFLLGLDKDRRDSGGHPNSEAASDDDPDALVEVAEEFLGRMQEPQDDRRDGASMPDEESAAHTASSSTSKCEGELPVEAIAAADGNPFTDFDSANFKARQVERQTGAGFHVMALAADRFVVVPDHVSKDPESPARDVPDAKEAEEADDRRYLTIPVDQLTLEDFPKGHPVYHCGLARYKRYLKKDFKFKPAYRSMWPLLLLMLVGAFAYVYPVMTLNLLPKDMVTKMVSDISVEKLSFGIRWLGALFAGFAVFKVLVARHVRRYMLRPGHAKYEEGIIRRKSTKISYTNIVNYDVQQGVIARLLGYGTVELSSAGSDGAELTMQNVLSPRLVEVVLEGKMEEARRALR